MIYVLFILIATLVFAFSLKLQHKQIPFILFASIGLILLIIASIFYSLKMPGVYTSVKFIDLRFLYNISKNIKISFSDIYRLSVMGSFFTYCSILSMTFNMITHKRFRFIYAFIIPLYVYIFINDPNIDFSLYIMSATNINNIKTITSFVNIYNAFVLCIYFSLPVFSIIYYYRSTSFMIKKQHAIFMLIYTIAYYMLLFILNSAGLIHFLPNGRNEIIKYAGNSLSDITLSTVLIFVCIIFISIVILTFKTSKMQNFSQASIVKNTTVIDKNLRMILHAYKNRFFAIHQQVSYLKDLDEPYSEKAKEILNSIDDFSINALSEISEKINSLQNIKLLYKPVDLIKCTDLAIEKAFIPENISIIKNYLSSTAIVFSEEKCMTEMIFNILQNSIEAFNMKQNEEHPLIKITIDTEPDWILFEIYDNGCGISPEVKKHIFAPLFSAKQGKNNFGIGLHYVKKIISAHHGYIFVESEQGSHTKFQVYLPNTPYREEKNKWNKLKLKLKL